MQKQIDIETERLILRRWIESDLEPFTKMNQDAEVMRYFVNTLTAEDVKKFCIRNTQEFSEYDYGFYAVEEKESGDFIGFIGFHYVEMDAEFCPCVEIGWRLNKPYWNKGYATEGAKACLKHGFSHLGFEKVYAFTTVTNTPSQNVMKKIGMKFVNNFDYPTIAEGHPKKPHVYYVIEKN